MYTYIYTYYFSISSNNHSFGSRKKNEIKKSRNYVYVYVYETSTIKKQIKENIIKIRRAHIEQENMKYIAVADALKQAGFIRLSDW